MVGRREKLSEISLANPIPGGTIGAFFEIRTAGLAVLYHNRMSGILVKIEGGYATVTGYKLPQPLVQ